MTNFRHIIRKEGLESLIITGYIEDRVRQRALNGCKCKWMAGRKLGALTKVKKTLPRPTRERKFCRSMKGLKNATF